MAGLVALDVAVDLVLASPLARARRRRCCWPTASSPSHPSQTLDALAPGGKPAAIVEAIAKHAKRHRRIALVGHEPDLGELAARLIGARGALEFKKGAICAIDVDGATPGGPGTLRWLLPPRALRALAP